MLSDIALCAPAAATNERASKAARSPRRLVAVVSARSFDVNFLRARHGGTGRDSPTTEESNRSANSLWNRKAADRGPQNRRAALKEEVAAVAAASLSTNFASLST